MAGNQTIAKNSIYMAIQLVLVLIVSLYTSRVILQVLGVEDFGIYNVVCGFVTMFAFLNTSMNNGIQRFYNYEYGKNGEEGAYRVFNSAIIIQFLLALVIVVLTETIGLWYLYEKMVIPGERFAAAFWIFQFSVMSLVILVMQIPFSASIMAHEKIKYFSIVHMVDAILKLLIALTIPFVPFDKLIGYGFLVFCISLINACLYIIYAKVHFKELKFHFLIDKDLIKSMLSFSGWNLFGSFAGVGKEQGINMILNMFFGPVVNAARGIAYQVTGALKSFVSTVTVSGRPQLTQSYAQGDKERTIGLMFSLCKMSFFVLFIFALPVTIEINYILTIWLGVDSIPEHTHLFVQLVLLTALTNVFSPPTSFVVHATGKMAKYQIITSAFSLTVLPLSYIFLTHGADAEIVFVLNMIITAVGEYISLRVLQSIEYFKLRDFVHFVLKPVVIVILISVPISVIGRFLIQESFIRLVITAILSVISIVGSVYFFALNDSEKALVKSMINKILRK